MLKTAGRGIKTTKKNKPTKKNKTTSLQTSKRVFNSNSSTSNRRGIDLDFGMPDLTKDYNSNHRDNTGTRSSSSHKADPFASMSKKKRPNRHANPFGDESDGDMFSAPKPIMSSRSKDSTTTEFTPTRSSSSSQSKPPLTSSAPKRDTNTSTHKQNNSDPYSMTFGDSDDPNEDIHSYVGVNRKPVAQTDLFDASFYRDPSKNDRNRGGFNNNNNDDRRQSFGRDNRRGDDYRRGGDDYRRGGDDYRRGGDDYRQGGDNGGFGFGNRDRNGGDNDGFGFGNRDRSRGGGGDRDYFDNRDRDNNHHQRGGNRDDRRGGGFGRERGGERDRRNNDTFGTVRMSNFHLENEDEEVEFKTRQQVLFERDPRHALPSQWKSLRDSKADGKYVTPNMPVPIVGEAVYGSHSVYSVLINQKRKLNHMYILASIAEDVKRAARPADFKDKDADTSLSKLYGMNDKNNHNPFGSDGDDNGDSLIDSSFLVDSTKLKTIVTNFTNTQDDDFLDMSVNADPSNKSKYVSPHHMESNREHLMMIYELAKTIPGLKITPLKRDKLDILASQRPHNGIILDAMPLQPPQKHALDEVDFFIPDVYVPTKKTSVENHPPDKQKAAAAIAAREEIDLRTQLSTTQVKRKPAIYFAVESIFDPNNLGAILRSSTFFGIDGLILPHNSCPLSPVVGKVSSGALDFMNIIKCKKLDSFIASSIENSKYLPSERSKSYIDQALENKAKLAGTNNNNNNDNNNTKAGLQRNFDKLCVVGLGLTNDINRVSGSNIFDFIETNVVPEVMNKMNSQNNTHETNNNNKTQDPFAILIIAGNEGFGLSPQIAEKCHLMLQIPSYQQFPTSFNGIKVKPIVDSLNVSNAVAIAINDVVASKHKVM